MSTAGRAIEGGGGPWPFTVAQSVRSGERGPSLRDGATRSPRESPPGPRTPGRSFPDLTSARSPAKFERSWCRREDLPLRTPDEPAWGLPFPNGWTSPRASSRLLLRHARRSPTVSSSPETPGEPGGEKGARDDSCSRLAAALSRRPRRRGDTWRRVNRKGRFRRPPTRRTGLLRRASDRSADGLGAKRRAGRALSARSSRSPCRSRRP